MDNVSLRTLIGKIPILKYKYLGCFCPITALSLDSMPNNTFQIVNSTSKPLGQHWLVIVKKDNVCYFGDSMGLKIEHYKELKKFHNKKNHQLINQVLNTRVQYTSDVCGFYAVYIAFLLFQGLPIINCDEYNLFKFINKYYS